MRVVAQCDPIALTGEVQFERALLIHPAVKAGTPRATVEPEPVHSMRKDNQRVRSAIWVTKGYELSSSCYTQRSQANPAARGLRQSRRSTIQREGLQQSSAMVALLQLHCKGATRCCKQAWHGRCEVLEHAVKQACRNQPLWYADDGSTNVRGRNWPGHNTDRDQFDKMTLAWCRIISSSRIAPDTSPTVPLTQQGLWLGNAPTPQGSSTVACCPH